MTETIDLFLILKRGGILMVPILICSILVFSIIIERIISYHQAKTNFSSFFAHITGLLESRQKKQAYTFSVNEKGILPLLVSGLLETPTQNELERKEVLTKIIHIQILPYLERFLLPLSVIAKGAPLLGLFGTVIGMVRLFSVIGIVGLGKPEALSDGISMALLTTAGGLFVAIIALFAHGYFESKVNYFTQEIQKATHEILDYINHSKTAQELLNHDYHSTN